MEKEEAILIIEQAINAATLKGVYSLQDMQKIIESLSVLK